MTRANEPRLTWESRFLATWPEVRRRLLGSLIRRGLSRSSAEDVTQEVALRVYRSMPTFEDADDLLRWASTVARRCAIDDYRKVAPLELTARITDEPADFATPEAAYEGAELLRAVLTEFSQLPDAQQQAFSYRGRRGDPSTIYMRRLRARRRLVAVIEAFGALLGWLARRLRSAPALAATIAATGIAVTLFIGGGAFAPSPPPGGDTVVAVPATLREPDPSPAPATPPTPPTARTTIAPQPRLTIDSPVEGRVSAPTPIGPAEGGVERRDGKRLGCVHLPAVGVDRCMDYPVRP